MMFRTRMVERTMGMALARGRGVREGVREGVVEEEGTGGRGMERLVD